MRRSRSPAVRRFKNLPIYNKSLTANNSAKQISNVKKSSVSTSRNVGLSNSSYLLDRRQIHQRAFRRLI